MSTCEKGTLKPSQPKSSALSLSLRTVTFHESKGVICCVNITNQVQIMQTYPPAGYSRPPRSLDGVAFAKRVPAISHQKSVGIIGRCDSEMATPYMFFSVSQAQEFIKAGRLTWIIDGELARKTYLFDEVRKPQNKIRKTGEWIPLPSPSPHEDWCGPVTNVLQFT